MLSSHFRLLVKIISIKSKVRRQQAFRSLLTQYNLVSLNLQFSLLL